MPAGILQKPGDEFGPCIGPCVHKPCREVRVKAGTKCVYCDLPIGYGVRFTMDEQGVVHEDCAESGAQGYERDPSGPGKEKQ